MIPGSVAPGTPINNQVIWGDNITVSVADPGFNCTVRLLIKARVEQEEADVTASHIRTGNAGNIVFTISGATSKEKLFPGTFYFQCLFIIGENSPSVEHRHGPQGTFELVENAGSVYVPVVTPEQYQFTIDLVLTGSTAANQIFGYYKVPSEFALFITKVTVIAQSAPDGGDLVLNIINGANQSMVDNMTLEDGDAITEFDQDMVACAADSTIRAKVISSAGDPPAENVTVRLHFSQQGEV